MSNSIIDQQRDNADFTEVFCITWSPWLRDDYKVWHLNEMRGRWYIMFRYPPVEPIETIFKNIQEMLKVDNKEIHIDEN